MATESTTAPLAPKTLSDYSPRNQLRILAACPHATELAGYVTWQRLGRQVRKGEKSIAIASPVTHRDDEGATRMVNVRGARVFDVTQTDPTEEVTQ